MRKIRLKGCFRFTEWQEGMVGLDTWTHHFTQKGIPSAIVLRRGTERKMYAVFRKGRESFTPGSRRNGEAFGEKELKVIDRELDFTLRFDRATHSKENRK